MHEEAPFASQWRGALCRAANARDPEEEEGGLAGCVCVCVWRAGWLGGREGLRSLLGGDGGSALAWWKGKNRDPGLSRHPGVQEEKEEEWPPPPHLPAPGWEGARLAEGHPWSPRSPPQQLPQLCLEGKPPGREGGWWRKRALSSGRLLSAASVPSPLEEERKLQRVGGRLVPAPTSLPPSSLRSFPIGRRGESREPGKGSQPNPKPCALAVRKAGRAPWPCVKAEPCGNTKWWCWAPVEWASRP